MDIRLDSLLTGAERAQGAVVIIDVFRAFTTAAVALARGAAKIIMVGTVEEALRSRDAGLGQICMGEVGGHKPDGFDLGNSPFDASQALLDGTTVIQRTSAGTQGIVAARQATQLYAGSLVTAKRCARPPPACGLINQTSWSPCPSTAERYPSRVGPSTTGGGGGGADGTVTPRCSSRYSERFTSL